MLKNWLRKQFSYKTVNTKYLIIGAGFSGLSLASNMTSVSNNIL